MMALTEETETQCWVKPDGQIEVLTKIWILRDGERLTSANQRHVVDVGDDVTNEDQLIKDVAQNLHTPERVNAREAARQMADQQGNISEPEL